MEKVFLTVFNMSVSAGWLVLAAAAVRIIFRNAPKSFRCVLWALVAVRLICPVLPTNPISAVPSAETVPTEIMYTDEPQIHSGLPMLNSAVNPALSQSMTPKVGDSVNPMGVAVAVAANVWILGMAAMALYAAVSYAQLRRRVRESVSTGGNVYECDRVDTPFILGVFRPEIYLPSDMDAGDREYVLRHENAHISRRDHWWKPLGFALLTVYWFNPLMWLAYVLLCRDIEYACDERVIKSMGEEGKKPYSMALINSGAQRRTVVACPLAFGEVGVKGRIKNVLNYKKPAFWVIITAVLLCIALAVLFLTNPIEKRKTDTQPDTASYRVIELIYDIDWFSFTENENNAPQYFTDGGKLYWNISEEGGEYLSSWTEIGDLTTVELDSIFDSLFVNESSWMYGYSLESVKNDNETAKKAVKGDMAFWLLTQKNGDVLLCRQFEDIGIRWVQRLSRTDGSDVKHYRFENDAGDISSLSLNTEDGTFTFHMSLFSSFLAMGEYTEGADYVLLTVQRNSTYSESYRFIKSEDELIFDAEASTAVPIYRYPSGKERCIPDGAVFVPVMVTPETREPTAGVDIACELTESHLSNADYADPYVVIKWKNLSNNTITISKNHRLCMILQDGGEDMISCDDWMTDNDASRVIETVTIEPHSETMTEYHFMHNLDRAHPCIPGKYKLYLAARDDLYVEYDVPEKWPDGQAVKWFDFLNGDRHDSDTWLETTLDDYPNITFRCNGRQLEAVKSDGTTKTVCGGMNIESVYFCDIIGSDFPQICVTVSVGQDLIGHRILAFDYMNGMNYAVEYQMTYDYALNTRDGMLIVEKRLIGEADVVETGTLAWRDAMIVYETVDS